MSDCDKKCFQMKFSFFFLTQQQQTTFINSKVTACFFTSQKYILFFTGQEKSEKNKKRRLYSLVQKEMEVFVLHYFSPSVSAKALNN